MAQEVPKDEEIINEIAKDVESQFSINDSDKISQKILDKATLNLEDDQNGSDFPHDTEYSDEELVKQEIKDDYVDEEKLKELELTLSEEDKEKRHKESLELKNKGNTEFKNEGYLESIKFYTEALQLCPLMFRDDRAIFYANRAACKSKLDRKQSAIDDCSKAIELNEKYLKAYVRRAKLYEESEKLDESLEDYKKILTFDPDNKDALQAQYRLPPLITERNEKLKTEMLDKLKDLGNMVLKPFGLSTENFQLQKDSNSGGYSVNFTQNPKR